MLIRYLRIQVFVGKMTFKHLLRVVQASSELDGNVVFTHLDVLSF